LPGRLRRILALAPSRATAMEMAVAAALEILIQAVEVR
jgi:hypothetical protein